MSFNEEQEFLSLLDDPESSKVIEEFVFLSHLNDLEILHLFDTNENS
jgi:hypothetical protein